MSNIIEKLATSLNRRDEEPNILLAEEIASQDDYKAVEELIENLDNKNKNIRADCLKTLYESGSRNPSLIADYYNIFIERLDSKDNRFVWGAMMALDYISSIKPDSVFQYLGKILDTAGKGSVITRDHAVGILINLSKKGEYYGITFPNLLEQLRTCPGNQFPMYAENSLVIINNRNKQEFIEILKSRLDSLEKDSQKKRIEKVLKKLKN